MGIVWFIIIVGALVVIQMEFFHIVGLRKVEYRRFWAKNIVYEGDKNEMVEVLENRKSLPIPWLRVESRISPHIRFGSETDYDVLHEQFHRSAFFLRGFKRIRRRHDVTCLHRGYYVLDRASLTSGDLFGLLSRSKEVEGDSELFVYPRPIDPQESPESLKWQGDIAMRRWIMPDPILISGIRDYLPGDAQKDIHWPATARTGKLQVKVRDFTVTPKVLVLLNIQIAEVLWGAMEPEQQEFIEKGVRIAAHLATWALESGMECGLWCNGRRSTEERESTIEIAPAGSRAQLDTIMQALCKMQIVCAANFTTYLDKLVASDVEGLDIVLISAYDSEAIRSRSEELRNHGCSVTFVPIVGDAEQKKEVERDAVEEAEAV